MSWPGSLFTGVIAGLITMVVSFSTADMAVGWYRISSFEGGSGYFVVGMALIGLVGGFVVGTVASRIVAARPNPRFGKALGVALVTSLGIVAIVGATARMLADVPPTLDGQELLLAAEIRWPKGRTLTSLDGADEWSLVLNSLSGRTVRASRSGPLWREEARLENDQWVVPGEVELFTSRGDRLLSVLPDDTVGHGFLIPLPGSPGPEHLTWSEWLPRARDGDAPLPDGFQYRFRVVPPDGALRTNVEGPFEIATLGNARFRIVHRSQQVAIEAHTEFEAVALLGGASGALLVQAGVDHAPATCFFLSEDREALRVTPVGTCGGHLQPRPLTSDNAAFTKARDRSIPAGRIDRVSFVTPGQYLLNDSVIDTRTLMSRAFLTVGQSNLIDRIPPLGVSPDDRSFIRLEWAEDSTERHVLAVTTPGTDERVRLPIDKGRMRYAAFDQIDPAWVLHHFNWEPTGDAWRLVERSTFTPIPWRGTLTHDGTGYREYRVGPALETLRPALIDFLVTEFQAERLEVEPSAFANTVRIQGVTVSISNNTSERHVGVWMDRGIDSTLVATIAARFDAALATGRYDLHFGS
jgi:hypothetical protein